MSRMTGTRHRPAGRPVFSLTSRAFERLERAGFERDFARSRWNADYDGCDECNGRGSCGYCGRGGATVSPNLAPGEIPF